MAQNAGKAVARHVRRTCPRTNPFSSAADLDNRPTLYNGRCGHCHGQNGEGGRGAVLNSGQFPPRQFRPRVVRHDQSTAFPTPEMPGAFNLPEADVWRLVAYVQQLGRQGATQSRFRRSRRPARSSTEERLRHLSHGSTRTGGFLGPGPDGYRREARGTAPARIRSSIRAPTFRSITGRCR